MRSSVSALLCASHVAASGTTLSCDSDGSSMLQARSLVRKAANKITDADTLLQTVKDLASSLTEDSDSAATPDDVNEAVGEAHTILETMLPRFAEEHAHVQQQIAHALAAVEACHTQHGGDVRARLENAVARDLQAKEHCEEELRTALVAEREACEGQGDHPNCLCNEARTAITDHTVLCESVTEIYKTAYCDHQSVCSLLQECHTREADVYTALSSDLEVAMRFRQDDYRTVRQAECITGLITAAMLSRTPIPHASLVACSDASIEDLVLSFPDIPPPTVCPESQDDAPECDGECDPDALEKCQGNTPCIDLGEGTNHHHLMWLNSDGTAHVDGEAGGINSGDGRTWTCSREGGSVGLVGTWNCPGFYSNIITITPDYADDFTTARTNDWVRVCALPEETTAELPVAELQAIYTWVRSSHVDTWCDNSNDDMYDASSYQGSTNWALDRNHGWRWCGISVEDCQQECENIGGCAGIYHTPNNCCFPTRSVCVGNTAPGGRGGRGYARWLVEAPTTYTWERAALTDTWCDHSNDDMYHAVSYQGSTNWANDPNHGWRWCGISVENCQQECENIGGCAGIYHTANNCCFPTRSVCYGNVAPGGRGGRTYARRMPQVPLTWVRTSNTDDWRDNLNDGHYSAVGTYSYQGSINWGLDRNHGWRWCGISVEDCQQECENMGRCAGIYHTPNNCCFPTHRILPGNNAPGGRGGRTYIAYSNAE